jgi:hypothetical protein
VRDAAGQLSDGFHLLRLQILRFETAALGHVQGNADGAYRFAVLPKQERPVPLNHRTVPSGHTDRCWTETCEPDFMAFSTVSISNARSSG